MCRAIFRASNTCSDIAPGHPLRSSDSLRPAAETAGSPASATCCPGTKPPTGLGPVAAESPPGPARCSRSGISASGAMPRLAGMRSADIRWASMPREAAARRLTRPKSPARMTRRAKAWAKLMARVGEEFPLACPTCGGDIRLIAFITDPRPVRKILTHLGEPLEPPPLSPARGPPTTWGELVQVHDDRAIFQASDRRAARDRHPQPLTGVGREASKPLERPTGTRPAPTREKRHRCGCGAFRETRSGRPGRSSRGSRVAHQPEDRCGSAIDRDVF
jgi:hypothetical protein